METDKMTIEDETTKPLSKEEILAVSREENKHGDERERSFYEKACALGFSVGLLVAGIIVFVTVLVYDRFPTEILLLTCSMQAVQNIVVGVGNRRTRKVHLILGIIEGVLAVVFLVAWILNMCGVIGH